MTVDEDANEPTFGKNNPRPTPQMRGEEPSGTKLRRRRELLAEQRAILSSFEFKAKRQRMDIDEGQTISRLCGLPDGPPAPLADLPEQEELDESILDALAHELGAV